MGCVLVLCLPFNVKKIKLGYSTFWSFCGPQRPPRPPRTSALAPATSGRASGWSSRPPGRPGRPRRRPRRRRRPRPFSALYKVRGHLAGLAAHAWRCWASVRTSTASSTASKSLRSHHKVIFLTVTFSTIKTKQSQQDGLCQEKLKRKTQPMFHSAFKNVNTGVNKRYNG